MFSEIKIRLTKQLFKLFLLIFLALLLTTLTDQALTKQIELSIRSTDGISDKIWLWGFLSIINTLLMPLVISMLCCLALVPTLGSVNNFFKNKFELGIIETMRLWGYTTLWSLLFILPGLYKYSVYLLSPLIVMFSKRYNQGEVDALKYSEIIAKKFYGKLNTLLLFFLFIIPMASSVLLDELKIFNLHPISATICVAVDSLVTITFHYFILKYFLKHLQEVENGTYV